MTKLPLIAILSALFLTSACGQSTGDRALSGAGIGAGIGLIGGALVGDPFTGAAIGGVAGAAAGAIIDKNEVNLGKPLWGYKK